VCSFLSNQAPCSPKHPPPSYNGVPERRYVPIRAFYAPPKHLHGVSSPQPSHARTPKNGTRCHMVELGPLLNMAILTPASWAYQMAQKDSRKCISHLLAYAHVELVTMFTSCERGMSWHHMSSCTPIYIPLPCPTCLSIHTRPMDIHAPSLSLSFYAS
jgi:hypothetical protein